MNRRKFLKFLGAGVAAGAVAPALLLKKEPDGEAGGWVSYRYRYTVLPAPDRTSRIRFLPEQYVPEQRYARLGEYRTYYSVSDPEIAKAIKQYEKEYEAQCHLPTTQSRSYVDYLVSPMTQSTELRTEAGLLPLSRKPGLRRFNT